MCKKWLLLPKELMKEYNIKPVICKYCGYFKLSLLLHVEEGTLGDYDCYLCEKDVELRSVCKNCKIENY